jgi:drug/metabolite transporter (DMT)-like permease
MLFTSIILTSACVVFFKFISVESRGEITRLISDARLYIAILIYFIAFMLWMIAASKIDYTVLIFSNVFGLVFGGLIGWYFFNETINSIKIASYFLICFGVILLATQDGY